MSGVLGLDLAMPGSEERRDARGDGNLHRGKGSVGGCASQVRSRMSVFLSPVIALQLARGKASTGVCPA